MADGKRLEGHKCRPFPPSSGSAGFSRRQRMPPLFDSLFASLQRNHCFPSPLLLFCWQLLEFPSFSPPFSSSSIRPEESLIRKWTPPLGHHSPAPPMAPRVFANYLLSCSRRKPPGSSCTSPVGPVQSHLDVPQGSRRSTSPGFATRNAGDWWSQRPPIDLFEASIPVMRGTGKIRQERRDVCV